MKKFLFILCLILPYLFFSCGEEKTETEKNDEAIIKIPGKLDACSMIDQEVLEKILNLELKEPKKGRSQKGDAKKASFSECSFESDEGSRIYLSVYIRSTPFKEEYHSTIQNVRSSFKQSGIEVRDIQGVGQVAFWGGNQLHVFKGDNYYLIVTLLGISEPDEAIEKTREVALHVIGNSSLR